MISAKIPDNEKERIEVLESLEILDSEPEEVFDEITRIAAKICSVPIALFSIVDEGRQWFKSKVGVDADETPRELAFCAHSILQDEPMIINDSSKDKRFHDNPLVVGGPKVAFYVGIPIQVEKSGKKFAIGTLCLIDNKPRQISPENLELLKVLAHQVETRLELRQNLKLVRNIAIKAEKASLAKSEFFSNISHEIRTPLNGILGFTNILSGERLNEEQSSYVHAIENCGEHLLRVINDLLDLSKIESGKFDLEYEFFDLSRTVQEIYQIFNGISYKKENVAFEVDLAPNLPKNIKCDPTRLKQIIFNLLGNAFKFTEAGTIKLITSYAPKNESSGTIFFEIKDTGSGICAEDIPTIFNRFQQAKTHAINNTPSTGLGLAVCEQLIKSMQGTVKLSSKLGEGTSIVFSIPVESKNEALKPTQKKSDSTKQDAEPIFSDVPVKLLIAEDNHFNRQLINKVMLKIGIHPDFAEDGAICLMMLEKKQYDLVFLDIKMPNVSGVDVIKWIRSNLNYKPVVFAVSASILSHQLDELHQLGFDDIIPKPINKKLLLNKLSQYIDKINKAS